MIDRIHLQFSEHVEFQGGHSLQRKVIRSLTAQEVLQVKGLFLFPQRSYIIEHRKVFV